MFSPEPPRAPFTYELQHGSYYFYGGTGKLAFMADQVSFAFDAESGIVFKHGIPERVEAYAAQNRARLAGNLMPDGSPPFTVAIVTFERGFSAEELTRFVNTAGYLKLFLEQNGYPFPPESQP